MDQKRFLTAVEVFQLFGVDAAALNSLVESGEVKALADRGSFKYRSDDFLRLVQDGKLSPRTAGEMFAVDSKGDIPFLKIKSDDQGLKFDDKVSFIELDEDALADQAARNAATPQTPVIPENWFEDLAEPESESKSSDTQDEIDISSVKPVTHEEATEYELKIAPESGGPADSDSDVQVFEEDGSIDFSEPDVAPSTSDSDVRLEGPISSTGLPTITAQKKPDSDSDVRIAKSKLAKPDSEIRLAKGKAGNADSDSDVRITRNVSGKADSDSDVTIATSPSEKPDSDSDVRIAKGVSGRPDSDSDVTIVTGSLGSATSQKKPESDSDVTIVLPGAAQAELASSDSDSDVVIADSGLAKKPEVPSSSLEKADSDSDVRLAGAPGDSKLAIAAHGSFGGLAIDDESGLGLQTSDSGIRLESTHRENAADSVGAESGIALSGTTLDSHVAIGSATDESGLGIESIHDSRVPHEPASSDSGISPQVSKSDGAIANAPADSGLEMESIHADSGTGLETAASDSGISLDASDSGISVVSGKPDSGISLDSSTSDSGISVVSGKPDSGIMLDAGDSGLGLEKAGDSGIKLENADSSIKLAKTDSGIKLSKTDSGISLDEEPSEASATLSDLDFDTSDSDKTQSLQLSGEHGQDSGFDVTLAPNDRTMEMALDDGDDSSPDTGTVIQKGRSKEPKKPALTDSFDLDDSLEVEDLDISDDLEGAPESEYSGEFAGAEEEVLEASDDDFSAGEISVAEEEAESEEFASGVKARSLPKEPAWGMLAVAPIICASLMMAVTVTVLWGGIVTMWSGAEAPGPAATLISTLAGLSPF